jgi:hypothetical protein
MSWSLLAKIDNKGERGEYKENTLRHIRTAKNAELSPEVTLGQDHSV